MRAAFAMGLSGIGFVVDLRYARNMLRVSHVLVALVAALVLAACAQFPQAAPKSIEGWLTPGTPSHAWVPVPPDRKIDLPPESVTPAAQMLERRDWAQLTPEDFYRLVPGRGWPSATGRVPYLLRGVALDEPQGAIRVLEHDTDVLVQYEGPKVRARAIATPVIVLLPAPPSAVYVKVSLFN